jgi:hypothetical protein
LACSWYLPLSKKVFFFSHGSTLLLSSVDSSGSIVKRLICWIKCAGWSSQNWCCWLIWSPCWKGQCKMSFQSHSWLACPCQCPKHAKTIQNIQANNQTPLCSETKSWIHRNLDMYTTKCHSGMYGIHYGWSKDLGKGSKPPQPQWALVEPSGCSVGASTSHRSLATQRPAAISQRCPTKNTEKCPEQLQPSDIDCWWLLTNPLLSLSRRPAHNSGETTRRVRILMGTLPWCAVQIFEELCAANTAGPLQINTAFW